jgi:hypothetical protein
MSAKWMMLLAGLLLWCTTSTTAPQNQRQNPSGTQPQSESRTEEQCQADANAWQSEYLDSGYNAVSLTALDNRAIEITNCGSRYGGDANFDYSVVLAGIWDTEERRERAYITENNLLNKFLAEDAAKAKGK